MTSERRWHPAASKLKPLPPEQYEALKQAIKERGGNDVPVLYRVLLDDSREYLDGRHRCAICDELGLDVDENRVFVADEDVEQFIIDIQNGRRQDEAEASKWALDRAACKAEVHRLTLAGHSTRQIAEALGVSQSTVHRDQKEALSHDSVPAPLPKILCSDGREMTRQKKGPGGRNNGQKEKKAGRTLVDWKAFDAAFGALYRQVAEVLRPLGSANGMKVMDGPEADTCRQLLVEFTRRLKDLFDLRAPKGVKAPREPRR